MIKIKGMIKTVKRIRYKNIECDGITRAHKQEFLIRIARGTFERRMFPEVLLHELVHLWFFICFGVYKLYIPEKLQHKLINQIVPRMSRSFLKILKTNGRLKK